MTKTNLKPYSTPHLGEAIRCKPILPPCGPEPSDNQLIEQGDYILFFKNKTENGSKAIYDIYEVDCLFPCFDNLQPRHTFREIELHGSIPTPDIPPDLKSRARELPYNQHGCIIAGSQAVRPNGTENKYKIGWIYPPGCASRHAARQRPVTSLERSAAAFSSDVHNLVVMEEEVYSAFLANSLGIDVDDEDDKEGHGKIYFFNESASQLKGRLPNSPTMKVDNERARDFLRHHFQHCLFVGIIGQDIQDDPRFDLNKVQRMLDKVPQEKLRTESPTGEVLHDALIEWAIEQTPIEQTPYPDSD
ncbi:hypothetical protein BD309DRAFT_1085174 [Dichomitus squalens]|nr:hypothetical protein BD309DRAFT_1085174 [Dichomitus squalens]